MRGPACHAARAARTVAQNRPGAAARAALRMADWLGARGVAPGPVAALDLVHAMPRWQVYLFPQAPQGAARDRGREVHRQTATRRAESPARPSATAQPVGSGAARAVRAAPSNAARLPAVAQAATLSGPSARSVPARRIAGGGGETRLLSLVLRASNLAPESRARWSPADRQTAPVAGRDAAPQSVGSTPRAGRPAEASATARPSPAVSGPERHEARVSRSAGTGPLPGRGGLKRGLGQTRAETGTPKAARGVPLLLPRSLARAGGQVSVPQTPPQGAPRALRLLRATAGLMAGVSGAEARDRPHTRPMGDRALIAGTPRAEAGAVLRSRSTDDRAPLALYLARRGARGTAPGASDPSAPPQRGADRSPQGATPPRGAGGLPAGEALPRDIGAGSLPQIQTAARSTRAEAAPRAPAMLLQEIDALGPLGLDRLADRLTRHMQRRGALDLERRGMG